MTNKELALNDLKYAFRGCQNQINEEKFSYAVRYWGNWENPEDAEDEEDYDWQVLDSESRKELKERVKEIENNRNVKIEYCSSEKCWIDFYVK